MPVRVLALRPRLRPRVRVTSSPSPSGSSSVSSWSCWAVGTEWDESRSLHVARCQQCAGSFASPRPGEVDDWADTHHCDPEMAALLAHVTNRRAA